MGQIGEPRREIIVIPAQEPAIPSTPAPAEPAPAVEPVPEPVPA